VIINARSLAKLDTASALCSEVTTNNIDICFISETWLNDKISSRLICPNEYTLGIRKDRSNARLGGGVVILCRSDWKIKKLDFRNNLECLGVKFTERIITNITLLWYIYHQTQSTLNLNH
jgi:hypothetical protein